MISLQISQELMDEFDSIQKRLGFSSRSEALRESIIFFIQQNQHELPSEIFRLANIVIHHDANRVEILDKYTEIAMKYDHLLKSVNQYNLKKKIVKSLIVAGPTEEIKEFFNSMMTQKFFKCQMQYIIVDEGKKD